MNSLQTLDLSSVLSLIFKRQKKCWKMNNNCGSEGIITLFSKNMRKKNERKLYGLWIQHNFYLNTLDWRSLGMTRSSRSGAADVFLTLNIPRKILSVIYGTCTQSAHCLLTINIHFIKQRVSMKREYEHMNALTIQTNLHSNLVTCKTSHHQKFLEPLCLNKSV